MSPALSSATPSVDPPPGAERPRLGSIDGLRGAVMVLMALDHVRVFAGVPPGGAEPALFFTRWITHFCAPVFVFLAGTGIALRAARHGALSRFLLLRGAWLVLLELTVVRLGWTFNLGFDRSAMAGILWAIGWSLILMAGLVRLPLLASASLGLVLVAGHDLLDPWRADWIAGLDEQPLAWLWKVLYLGFFAGPIQVGTAGPRLMVLYSIVPWVGVLALGHAFGRVLGLEPAARRRACLGIGLGALALFGLLRGLDLYGDPRPWRQALEGPRARPALLAFLDVSKYPASLSFLLMTLGPAIALLPWLESRHGRIARGLMVFGRVPLFYYLLHIPLIHALALVVCRLRTGALDPWLFADHPMGVPPPPADLVWGLPLLYGVWILAVALLYPPCRWFAAFKARTRATWASYL